MLFAINDPAMNGKCLLVIEHLIKSSICFVAYVTRYKQFGDSETIASSINCHKYLKAQTIKCLLCVRKRFYKQNKFILQSTATNAFKMGNVNYDSSAKTFSTPHQSSKTWEKKSTDET